MSESRALQIQDIDDPLIQRAISLRLEGMSWKRIAARLNDEGFRGNQGGLNHAPDIWKRCKPYVQMIEGDKKFQTVKEGVLEVAIEANAQTMEALIDGEIPKNSLAVTAGIFNDKYARYESIQRQPTGADNPMLEMLAKLTAGGGTVKLEVTPLKTIDITPEEDE